MKYVQVNGGQPRGGFVLVNDDADAEYIIAEAIRTKGYDAQSPWVLAKHNANGTSMIVQGDEALGHADFDMFEGSDNA